jgi:carbon monoxide dehydrogenase subunit G
MASIRKEITIEAPPETVWAAFRDVGAVHERLAPGFVTDCRMDGEGARIVTFANGLVARELIVDVDDSARRLAYSARGGRSTHHNASFQVFAEGPAHTRLVWIADVLPHEVAKPIGEMMEAGCQVMQRTLQTTRTGG